MNTVDLLVKKILLSSFSIYPSRVHVLNHVILGNGTGYEWVKLDDGFYHLQNSFKYEDTESIELLEIDNKFDKIGKDFYNHIVNWVNDNIDVYSKGTYFDEYLNLKPKTPLKNLSRGFNRLCDMPKLSLIHPDWIKALNEVVDEQIECYKRMDSRICLNFKNRDSRNLISHKYNAFSTQFCIIANAKEKLKVLEEDNNKSIENLFGTTETRYNKLDFKDKISFEKYKLLEEENLTLSHHVSYIDYAKKYIKTRELYFPDGNPNELFKEKALDLILNHHFYLNKFNTNSLISEIVRKLKISGKDFIKQVDIFVHDNMYEGISCS